MSQAGGPSSGGGFGEARIDFTGNTAPLEQAAAKAVAVTQETAKAAEAAVGPTGGVTEATRKYAESLDGVEESGLKAGRRMLGLAGTAAALLGAFEKLSAGIQAFRESSEKLADDFAKINEASGGAFGDSATGIVGALNDTNAALDRQRAEIGKAMDDWGSLAKIAEKATDALFGGAGKKIQESQLEQIEEARKRFEEETKKRLDAEAKAEAEAAEKKRQVQIEEDNKRSAAIEDRIRREVASSLSGEEKIAFETETKIMEIDKLREKASIEDRKRYDELERIIRKNADAERREIEKSEANKRAEAEKTAAAIERAFSRALGQVQQQSAALFTGDQVTAQLERVASLLEQIADQRSMIGGRD